MPQKPTAKVKPVPSSIVVVFGVDDYRKPHAAWFSKTKAEPARAAAHQLGFNVAEAKNGVAADLGAKLAEGQIHATGSGLVPTIREDLYEQIVATLNSRGEAGQEPGTSATADLPESWNAIKPGHLVIARESLVFGWWEAIVVNRTADKITVRWRDYPRLPHATVPATAVALLNPKS